MKQVSSGTPGPYSCALAALSRARTRYDEAAKRLIPRYHHNDSKLIRSIVPMSNARCHAIDRTMQWHKEWIVIGEETLRQYTREYQRRTGSWCQSDGT